MAVEPNFSQNLDGRNRGGVEPKKKLKKRRSIRVSRVPSLRQSSSRRSKSRFNWLPVDLSSDASSYQQLSSTALSDSTPNYMKSTSSFIAKKGSSQGGSENDDIKSVASSSCGSSDRVVHPFVEISDDALIHQHPSSTEVSDASFGHCDSESSYDGNDPSERSHSSESGSLYSSQKSLQTSSKTSAMRNMRILIKKASFKPKRSSLKSAQISEDLHVDRATCSSTIKDSRFPEHVELQAGETESERKSFAKVCRYHHCSLNGHCHDPLPPIKQFLYKKRRSMKQQMNVKRSAVSGTRTKPSADRKKDLKKHQISSNIEPSMPKGAHVKNDKSKAFTTVVHTEARAQLFRGANGKVDDPDHIDIAPNGSSNPEKDEQENLDQTRNSFTEEDIPETTFELKDACLWCSNMETAFDQSISPASSVELEDQKIAASSRREGENNLTIHGESAVFCQTDSLELYPVGTSCQYDANLNSRTSENIQSGMTRNLSSRDSDEATKDNSAISSASNSHTSQDLSASTEETTSNLKLDRGLVTEFTPDGNSGSRGSETAPSSKVQKPQFNRGKHTSMWNLIHKHMASSLAAEDVSKPFQIVDEEKKLEETEIDTAKDGSYVCPDSSDSYTGIDNHETENQEFEIRKLFAIKLVREAIEKILLPEVQDQSSENQSTTSDTVEDRELPENNHQEGPAEDCYSRDGKITEDSNTPADPGVQAGNDAITSGEEKNQSETKLGKKSDKKSPSGWSNLRKWILLQRFVKELEKFRKFNPRKQRHLQLETDPEAEKVNLRRQTVDERKRAEEWMLDYALRQVVSELAPTQKRKVALLVKAFETVVPPQEDNIIQVTNPQLKEKSSESACITSNVDASISEMESTKTQTEGNVMSKPDETQRSYVFEEHCERIDQYMPVPVVDDTQSSTDACLMPENIMISPQGVPPDEESQEEISAQTISSLSTGNLVDDSEPNTNLEKLNRFSGVTGEHHYATQIATCKVDVISVATEEKLSARAEITRENLEASEEEYRRESQIEQVNIQDLPEDTDMRPISKVSSSDTTIGSKSIELDDSDGKADEPFNGSNGVLLDSVPETMVSADYSTLVQHNPAGEETNAEFKLEPVVIREFPPKDFKSQYKENKACQSKLDKQNYIKMWHMVYQHVALSIATKVGNQLLEGEDEEVEDATNLSENGTFEPQRDPSEGSHEEGLENCEATNQHIEFSRSDAVRLVQEAVDEILDDISDTQSVTSETIPDQDLSENVNNEAGELSILNSAGLNEEHKREIDGSEDALLDEEENGSTTNTAASQEYKKVESPDKNKSNPSKMKNWSKLKKIILLKRSIKAMEKSRKSKSQPQEPLPLPEPEKIDLKHQMMDERRKAEQWMLDYAVQNIVTQLTPARKKRVAMLVEAFEAVVPLPEM